MKKEEVFIDLSKYSEEQIKSLALVVQRSNKLHDKAFDYMSKGETLDVFTCLAETDLGKWTLWNENAIFNKTELTYPEFIKLFEGGEDNNGWIKIESKSQYDLLENGEYHWYNINTGRYDNGDLWEFGTFTHYQPIQKPLPPKF